MGIMEYFLITFSCLSPFYGFFGGMIAAKRNIEKFGYVILCIYFWPFFLLKDFIDIIKQKI